MKITEFFDKGFYLNLDHRTDRKELFKSNMKEFGLDNFFERFSAIYHGDPMYNFHHPHDACGTSHLKLLNKCYEEGYNKVIILEDDAKFTEFGINYIEKALDDLSHIPDWDTIYLGSIILDPYLLDITENLLNQTSLLTLHAVGYSKKGLKKLVKMLPKGQYKGAIDAHIGHFSNNLNKYVVYPLGIVQHTDTPSDLDNLLEPGSSPVSNGISSLHYLKGYKLKKYREYKKEMHNLKPNFITCGLQGRTGNMMFQIANAYVQSLKYGYQFVAPRLESSSGHLENCLFRKIDFFIDRTDSISNPKKNIRGKFIYHEVEPPEEYIPTVYYGWFQSEKFFQEYKEQVRSLFSPTQEFLNKAYTEYPFLKNEVVAAINVRRGDYLHPDQNRRHPVISLEYIQEAYKKLPKHDKLLVMSDDIDWCKKNIDFPNIVFNDNSKFWDGEGLWLLSLCEHFIISNSTYSWWGAWLSRYDRKTVIAPDTWFGPDIDPDANPKDIYCDGWIKIPTKFQDGFIVPLL